MVEVDGAWIAGQKLMTKTLYQKDNSFSRLTSFHTELDLCRDFQKVFCDHDSAKHTMLNNTYLLREHLGTTG
jgi:hypothetical protein